MRDGQQKKRFTAQWAIIALFALPLLLAGGIVLRGQRELSETENRTLTRFPAFSWPAFVDGSFQDTLEDALGDQLLFSGAVKEGVQDARNAVTGLQRSLLYSAQPALRSGYSPIAEGYCFYAGEENRIVEVPQDYLDRQEHLDRLAASFRDLPDVRLCLYFIENSRVVDFDHPETADAPRTRVLEAFQPDASDVFRVPDWETYKKLFYQTDHHWNQEGAYLGYQAICRLLHPEDWETLLLKPEETVTLPVVFQGSYARQTHLLCADEPFTVQRFELPAHQTLIQGKRGTYGHRSLYERGKKIPTDALRNHYAYCFGGDYALVEFDFNQPERGNLLLVASSYSNPINELIAAGYGHTWVVDLRYWEAWAGTPFDPAAFCAEHDVRDVLLLGDVNLFYVDEAERGSEE